MKKRYLLIPICGIVFLQLFHLFCLHFDGTVQPKSFEHGFKQTYATKVSGLDYTNLDAILSQPYHYLGNGKQMTALVSADGNYVLKLFNPMRPLKPEWYKKAKFWKRYSSLKWIKREWFQKEARLKKLFERHKWAYEQLQKETGLLFVHLEPLEQVNHFLHVTDRSGKKLVFSLAHTPFVLQERATLVPEHLSKLLKENKREEALVAIRSLEGLLQKRIQVGITDRIQTMENNYGFVGNRPIQIDVGRIRIDSDLLKAPEVEQTRILGNFREWIKHTYPEL